MIIQGILDFFRDVGANFLTGVGVMIDNLGGAGAAQYIGHAFGNAGHFVALFISSVAWAALVSAFGAYVTLFLATGVIAIFTRRGTSS